MSIQTTVERMDSPKKEKGQQISYKGKKELDPHTSSSSGSGGTEKRGVKSTPENIQQPIQENIFVTSEQKDFLNKAQKAQTRREKVIDSLC